MNPLQLARSVASVSFGFLLACGDSGGSGGAGSGSGSGSGGATAGTGGATTGGASSSGGGGSGAGGVGGSTSTGVAPNGLSVNEIQAHGAEWLELYNAGDAAIDLGGLGVCDEDANGDCEVAAAIRFPSGTTLAAGAALLVLANQDPMLGVGPHNLCTGAATVCFYAPWKISATDGETIRVIDASDQVIAGLTYPPGQTATDMESFARIPDGVGPAVNATPTPGAPNQP